jgi:hypothetical protein
MVVSKPGEAFVRLFYNGCDLRMSFDAIGGMSKDSLFKSLAKWDKDDAGNAKPRGGQSVSVKLIERVVEKEPGRDGRDRVRTIYMVEKA